MATGKVSSSVSGSASVYNLSNVVGDRGEKIFELAITYYKQFKSPLFRAGFLGEKWPSVDFYVELLGVPDSSPFFFVQVKATAQPLSENVDYLEINADKEHCERLFWIPGPTYIAGVHEPTGRTFLLSVHEQPEQGIYRIPLKNELTSENLKVLHDEVSLFWKSSPGKPKESHFR